ncbi:hypothetical protein PV435_48395, partial [Streptomyces scabiei]|nr:hypothetical protein [Streptomyces scabiei]
SQQRKLLKLTPELQDLVAVGEMPVRVARDIAGLPPEVQGTAWEEELERRRLEKEAGARLRAERAREPVASRNGGRVREVSPAPRPDPAPERFTAVNRPTPAPALNSAPTPALNPQADGGDAVGGDGRSGAPVPSGPAPDADGRDEPETRPTGQPEQRVPEPRPEEQPVEQEPRQAKMPWDDGEACAEIVIAKMAPGERRRMMMR